MPSLQRSLASVQSCQNSGENKWSEGTFVQVPLEILRNEQLSPTALKLYLFLLAYCGAKSVAWPSQARLAKDMHLTERRVRSLITELAEVGLVVVQHSVGNSNTYQLRKAGLKKEATINPAQAIEERSFPAKRKNVSHELHESESKHVCKDTKTVEQEITRESPSISPPCGEPIPGREESTAYQATLEAIQTLFTTAGLSTQISRELAEVIIKNQRDTDYVKAIIAASQQPAIHNPAGFIRFMVLRNAAPLADKPGRNPKPQRRKASVTAVPLDFSKYTSGKYAHLTQPESNPVVGVSRETCVDETPNIWPAVRRKLALLGILPIKTLEHVRFKSGNQTGECIVELPLWAKLPLQQEKTFLQELGKLMQTETCSLLYR